MRTKLFSLTAAIYKEQSRRQLVFSAPFDVEMQKTGSFKISFNQSLQKRVHRGIKIACLSRPRLPEQVPPKTSDRYGQRLLDLTHI